jgi:vWA found in TerF C terminus
MPVSIDKIAEKAPGLVDISKKADDAVNDAGLNGHIAKVALCLDISGSMIGLYRSGYVQRVAEQFLALGMRFDDDGAIDVFAFGDTGHYLGELTIENYQGGVDRLTRELDFGTTNYVGAMRLVRSHFLDGISNGNAAALLGRWIRKGKKAVGADAVAEIPVHVGFVSDGEPNPPESAVYTEIEEAQGEPFFWSTIGVGGGSFTTLRGLAQRSRERGVHNVGFFDASKALTDSDMLKQMLAVYPTWVTAAKAAGRLR